MSHNERAAAAAGGVGRNPAFLLHCWWQSSTSRTPLLLALLWLLRSTHNISPTQFASNFQFYFPEEICICLLRGFRTEHSKLSEQKRKKKKATATVLLQIHSPPLAPLAISSGPKWKFYSTMILANKRLSKISTQLEKQDGGTGNTTFLPFIPLTEASKPWLELPCVQRNNKQTSPKWVT